MQTTGIDELLRNLSPFLDDGEFVFCDVPDSVVFGLLGSAFGAIHEDEGWTLILSSETAAREGLGGEGVFRKITLRVHSSLDAVGLTAAVSSALAEAGIAANVVAALHHDHIFVPADRAAVAMSVLEGLQARVRGE